MRRVHHIMQVATKVTEASMEIAESNVKLQGLTRKKKEALTAVVGTTAFFQVPVWTLCESMVVTVKTLLRNAY